MTFFLAAPALAERVVTISGEFEEPVRAIGKQGEVLVLETTKRRLPCAEVREVRFSASETEPRPGPVRLFFRNGDELTGAIAGGDEEKVVLETGPLGRVEVPLDALAGVAWTAGEQDLRRFRREILVEEPKSDVIVTRAWGRTEGVIERIDEKGFTIESKAIGKVTLAPEKALGARIAALGKKPPAPEGLFARVELSDGSAITARPVSLEDGALRLDWRLRSPIEVRLSDVRSLSFLGGRFIYLSDLEPAETSVETAVISKEEGRPPFPYVVRDRAVGLDEAPIRLDGRTYRKGLGVHAYSRVVYDLRGEYVRFFARIGLDDGAKEMRTAEGTVKFQVLVDGKPALGEGGVLLTTRDASRPIEVDVTGAKKIALVADFGESKDILARGDFADAYLVRK
jgi:hypothetical protein